jgi:hypothetical protein
LRSRDRSAWCAGLGGFILAVLERHISSTLVSIAPALLGVVAATLAGLSLRAAARTSVGWLIAGALFAMTLPSSIDSSDPAVITHAWANVAHDDLIAALEQLDDNPVGLVGRHLAVKGRWQGQTGQAAATVSERIMACCAADAVNVGFDVFPIARVNAPDQSYVSVSGFVRAFLRGGETRYALINARVASVSEGSSAGR